jgi:hypothetical protein
VTTQKVAIPEWLTAADRLRLYTPEEVIEMGLLPYGSPRTLREACYSRKIPFTKIAGKIRFNLGHVYAIQQAGDVDPAARGRRRAA